MEEKFRDKFDRFFGQPPAPKRLHDVIPIRTDSTGAPEGMQVVRAWLMLADMSLTLFGFIVRNQEKMTPAQHKDCVALLNKTMDLMEPLSAVVNVVAKYCLKLQAAQLGIERVFDAADDLVFARDIRTELAALRE